MPVLKERTYAIEEAFLSPYATKSKDTKGRSREEKRGGNRCKHGRTADCGLLLMEGVKLLEFHVLICEF